MRRYGGITIVLARFRMPFARTFAPVVAGVAEMTYRRFAFFNIIGGIGWVVSMTLIGYFLGRLVPGIEKYVEYLIVGIVFISVLPLHHQVPAAPGRAKEVTFHHSIKEQTWATRSSQRSRSSCCWRR